MDKNKNTNNKEEEKPPEFEQVWPPVYIDAVYLPTIDIKIKRREQNIKNEEEDEKIYEVILDKKEKEFKRRPSKDENDEDETKIPTKVVDEYAIDYEKIVLNNNEMIKELSGEVLEMSNCIKIIFNEIEIITANPNVHSKGKLYKITYFIRNYIPVIKDKFKKFRSKHYEDDTIERIRSQLYFQLKLYFDIAYEYVKENYDLKLGDELIENYK